MTDEEFVNYISTLPCFCQCCASLKMEILDKGVSAIDLYDGMICGGVSDMIAARNGYNHEAPKINIFDCLA